MKTESIKILVIEEDPIWVQFIESIFDNAAFELLGFVKPVEQARDIIEKENSFILICDINNINESSILRLFENEKYANIPTIFMTNILDANTHKIVTLAKKSTLVAKPFHKFTLLSLLDLMQRKYLIKKKNNNSFIEVRDKHSHIIQLQLENIDWIHAEGNYSIINTVNQRKFVRKIPLCQIMDSLDDRFVQVQKSYVINKDYINNISVNKTALVINDTSIPIGRSFRQSLFLSLSENKLDN